MKSDINDIIAVFNKSPSFDHMPLKAIRHLACDAEIRRIRKNRFVFQEGDSCSFFYLIKQGLVKCYKEALSGKLFIMYVASDFEVLDAVVLFSRNPHLITAKALRDTTLIRVQREKYISWAQQHPSHMLKVITLLEKMVGASYDRLLDMVEEVAYGRVCYILFLLFGKFGANLSFTSREIAELAGTTTETAIRIIAKLKSEQILLPQRGKIEVLEPDRLNIASCTQSYVIGKI